MIFDHMILDFYQLCSNDVFPVFEYIFIILYLVF